MTDAAAWLQGDSGAVAAILTMAAATYLCRILGVWLMSHVPPTPRVKRALAALPGSIIAATVLPLVVRSGPSGVLALVAAAAVMLVRRNELLALATGLGVVAGARALGL